MNTINIARLLWTRFQLLFAAPNATGSGAPGQHVGGRESVLQEYARRLSLRQTELAGIRQRHLRLWAWLTVVGIASCWIVIRFASHSLTSLWVVLPVFALAAIFRLLSQNARVHAGVSRILHFAGRSGFLLFRAPD